MQVFTCLAVDGGGIRGLYSAAVLDWLMKRFAAKRNVSKLDVGKGFDLVAGTSTGGILACGLAHGCSPARLVELYQTCGPKIFSGSRLPSEGRAKFLAWAWRHRAAPIHNSDGCLRQSLVEIFGNETLATLYDRRSIAVCIPAIRLLNESPRVFKTGHLGAEYRRDDAMSVVDVCMATSTAPVFLPLASIKDGRNGTPEPYVDGGLWMNNPTLIAMLEALALTKPQQEIVIISVGTCLFQQTAGFAAKFVTERAIFFPGGYGFENFGFAAEDATREANQRLTLPGEQFRQKRKKRRVCRGRFAIERIYRAPGERGGALFFTP